MELEEMPNIGKVVSKKLIAVGIDTPDKLIELGSKEAFIRLRSIDDTACFSMLQGLEGAVQGVRWHMLPESKKKDLKKFFDSLK
ncbi:MAG TPA: TfoX/Sxy family protein [Methanofastidiosum sp.]|jgi:DNA transformation protein|nr:TfoX/Sxy family protein [Methanofastidiosum sp.]HOG74517.1 TfoX/Sxy family protein [Methanofastidiosum sp.]HPA49940.1 TfoX/Sxy family protein [Methanofastidiosum sp.]HQQ49160.1 TfoX/Sxy family protein [Methanofastidiosum sp.]